MPPLRLGIGWLGHMGHEPAPGDLLGHVPPTGAPLEGQLHPLVLELL